MSTQLPHITVATMVASEGRLLMVKEHADGELVYNQPAGHLESDETLLEAAVRETLEETAWQVAITALLGIYQYTATSNGIAYVRLCFIATPQTHLPDNTLDTNIEEAIWLTPAEIEALAPQLRSPLVLAAVRDYQAGKAYPLSLLSSY